MSKSLNNLQRFSVDALWHFTGYGKPDEVACETLHKIVSSQTLKVSSRGAELHMSNGHGRTALQYSCCCDIPFRDLEVHTARYGNYGIAFHRGNATAYGGFNPVFYVDRNSDFKKRFDDVVRRTDQLIHSLPSHDYTDVDDYKRLVETYIKLGIFNTDLRDDSHADTFQENNFYLEREWRSMKNWTFDRTSVLAVMIPNRDLNDFRRKYGDALPYTSFISHEHIRSL